MNHTRRIALLVQLADANRIWHDVGYLRHSNEITWFETLPSYWETPDRPVLGQVFEDRDRTWRPSQRVALPNWFSHLLPEGRLRSAVSAAAQVNEKREFFLLARIGAEDLPGALKVTAMDADHLTQLAHPDVSEAAKDTEDPVLKFSLAGVQLKFSLRLDPDRGLTIPARGQAGDWIVKLPDGRPGFDAVSEAECGGLELASRAAITVPEHWLVDASRIEGIPEWAKTVGTGKALAIRRFDRTEGDGRVHAEELAQVLDIPTSSDTFRYRRANFETIAALVGGLCGAGTVAKVIDRIVLNVLIGNGDAHLKNWAIIYPNGRIPALSPAYDIVPTVLYIPDDDLGLKLNSSRSFEDVTVKSFDGMAERAGWDLSAAHRQVASAVERVLAHWSVLRDFLTSSQFDVLTARLQRLPLLKSAS